MKTLPRQVFRTILQQTTWHMSGSIFLVGLMGTGKTTIGRALAKKLDKRFVDSDHEIELRTGASIPMIFEIEGEESFRKREADVIRELSAQKNIVLATGGGALLRAETRACLKQHGTVIYLRADVNQILQRAGRDKNRPLLQTADPRKKLEELSRQREPYYQEVADFIIETSRPNMRLLVQFIMSRLELMPEHTAVSTSTPASLNRLPAEPVMSVLPHAPITLQVDLEKRSYPITIGHGLLSDSSLLTRHIAGKHAVIVTNDKVGPLYLAQVRKLLEDAGKQVTGIVLPDGEETKNWTSLMKMFDVLLTEKCDRKTTMIALGGGVIGDLTGFAAATYMRGVPFVQIPTTLLAQADSSVGGKTGINHPLGKNMIGAFHQPQAVIADTATLHTLPARELSAGLAEVIKHGAIIDISFFGWIETNIGKLMVRDNVALAYAIQHSCKIKADVVRQDEREGGLRAILNFGHTFGHAIESGLGYGQWLHGEAVGCGMVMAADLSYRLGYIDATAKNRLTALVKAAGLPATAPDLGLSRWLELMEIDKKNENGRTRFILLKPLGHSLVTDVPQNLLLQTLTACTPPLTPSLPCSTTD